MKAIHYLTIIFGAVSIGLLFPALDQEQGKLIKFFFVCVGILLIVLISKSVTKV
jgi:hypothetical protein